MLIWCSGTFLLFAKLKTVALLNSCVETMKHFTFTLNHLADTFIQSDFFRIIWWIESSKEQNFLWNKNLI